MGTLVKRQWRNIRDSCWRCSATESAASFFLEFFDNEYKYEKHDEYWLGRQCCGRRAIAGGTTKEAEVGCEGFAGVGRGW